MYNKSMIIKNPIYFLAFGLGLGLSPFAPGTFGTLLGVLIYIINHYYIHVNEFIIIIISFIVGVYICDQTAKALNHHDHPGIVWDEVVGYLITMINIKFSFLNVVLGFILFRFFDILKPWPIKIADQKILGGFGIMIDDVLAAVYANITLSLIIYYLL